MNEDSDNSNKPPPSRASNGRGDFSVTSWNVNSIKMRLPQLLTYLKTYVPDVMMLQEIKTETGGFPYLEIESAGYHALVKGQKSYNGVAILSKEKLELISDKLPDAPDTEESHQARYIEAKNLKSGQHFICVYVPNGEPPANDPKSTHKLEYKVAWMDALKNHIKSLMLQDVPFVLGGDFNVIEKDNDVYDITEFKNSAFTVPAIRERFRALAFMGLTNALRLKATLSPLYSYWDYRLDAWNLNHGILLDHLFVSPTFADKLYNGDVDADFRGNEKASDHAPIWCSFIKN